MKIKNNIISVLITINIIIFTAGCMTSQGSLFDEVASADTEDSSEDDNQNSYEEEFTGLTIRTNPGNADVFINNNYVGISPVSESLSSGNYRIRVEVEGYYSTTEWVNYSGEENLSLNINLQPIIGFLDISISPQEANISSGWDNLYEGLNEIQIGKHLVSAELFGYEKWEKYVNIHKNKTTSLEIQMEPSVFKISNLFLSRQAFNPENPEGLGDSKISFNVNTYGSGEITIISNNGDTILTNIFPHFNKWNQSFVWKGKDDFGNLMPDGIYRVVVSGTDMKGKNKFRKETFITIDSSIVIKIRTNLSGTSGTLYCPTPDILPEKSFQLSLSSFGSINENTYRFPFSGSVRFIPKNNLEITGQLGIVVLPETSESYFLSGSVKNTILKSKTADISWYLKGSYQNNHKTDSQTNFTGLSAGLPMAVSISPVTLIVTPEIILSPFRISYEGTAYDPGFYTWGYGRAAIILDLGQAMFGLSTAVRLTPYTMEINSENPLSAGLELNYLIPGTGIFITGIVSGEFGSMTNYYINAGGGIGFIN